MAIDWRMLRAGLAAIMIVALAGCGGGGGGAGGGGTSGGSSSSASSSTSSGATTLTNFTTVTIDAGPAALNVGANGYTATNSPYVTITVCAPGSTSNCQTIDHVLLDTGSTGLRLEAAVLTPALLAALTPETDPAGNPVGECYEFVENYVFGSVRIGDFSIGGESVAAMPMQVIGDTATGLATVPATCSATGGQNMTTVQQLGANGIIGVGLAATDCATTCTTTTGGSTGGVMYYDCPPSGCSTIIARNAVTSAPFEQLPNPVAAFPVDNNGTVLTLPAVPALSARPVIGTITFGIGTQTNNTLGNATVLETDRYGFITANYNNQSLINSFLDSGSNFYYFVDTSLTACTQSGFSAYYCPTSPLLLSPTLTGSGSAASLSAAFTLDNAETQLAATAYAVPGVGANTNLLPFPNPIPNSFDFGLPFFYGKSVYTGIAGRKAGTHTGPFFAY